MAEPVERQRTVLRAPRVEFDLSAMALGAGGWLAYQWSWPLLATLLGVPDEKHHRAWAALRNEFFGRALGWLDLPYADHVGSLAGVQWPMFVLPEKPGDPITTYALDLPWWKHAVVAAWLLVLWSVVAGAISRVYAVRIARDESIGVGDGLAFSFSNLRAFLQAPLFVAAAAGLFLGLAALAGAASAVPGAGPFIEVVAHPLAFVAGLVVVVIAAGGVFGLPVMQAALATERNGTLDAISRTFSYVFTKPVAYGVSVSIVTAVAGAIAAFGGAFIGFTQRAMVFGASWSADPSMPIDAPRAIARGMAFGASGDGVLGWPHPVPGVEDLPHGWIYVAWAFSVLASLAVNGWVLSYFVGGLTDTYFLLRREVDGIDDGEVYTEGAEATLGEPLAGEPSPAGRTR
jgi:hypothetical protein